MATRGKTWEEAEVLVLIDIFWGERIQSQIDNTVRNKSVYKKCADEMMKHGFERTPAEIRTKVNNLKSWYRRQTDRAGKPGPSGGGRQKRNAIYVKLDEYLSDKPSTRPTVIVESNDDDREYFIMAYMYNVHAR